MGTVTAGQSLTVNIPADTAWTVTTTGEATVFLVSGAAGAGYTSWRVTPTQPKVIAPFSAAGIIRIVGVSGVTTDGAQPPEGVSRARAEQLDALVLEAGNITAADLATTTGTLGQTVRLSDGDNKGAILMWSTPAGSSTPAWCWWLWPQSPYEA